MTAARRTTSYIEPANSRSVRLAERLGGVADPVAPNSGGDPECLVYRYLPGAEA